MKTNREILDWLFETNQIELKRSRLFETSPTPLSPDFDFDRVEGMMLGLAIGDSLGNTTEGQLPKDRRKAHGEIRNYLPNRQTGSKIGLPSDDTQLAFWTLEQMISDERFDPDHVAACFCKRKIFGIGSSVRVFLTNYKSGLPWYKCGPKQAGNGALMRIAPMVIPHLRNISPNLWGDTALSAMITHNDSGSISACIAFVMILWELLRIKAPPKPEWWLETYVRIAKDLEKDEKYQPRSGAFKSYRGPIWKFTEDRVNQAYRDGKPVLEACNSWFSGAYLLETVPSVIYILMRHGHDLEEAIVRAVNDTKDNDTVAAIVGATVGALHGKKKIPARWLDKLSGTTGADDDGKVFDLLEHAKGLSCFDTKDQEKTIKIERS